MIGHIVFVVGAAIAGGLLAWWAYVRFTPKMKKGGGRRY
jgi:DNA-binding transcriptional regulator of glucitol operon